MDRSQVARARWSWDAGPTVALSGISVASDGWALRAGAARVGVAFGPLVLGRMRPSEVQIDSPRLTVDLRAPERAAPDARIGAGALPLAIAEAELEARWGAFAYGLPGHWRGTGRWSAEGLVLAELSAERGTVEELDLAPGEWALRGLRVSGGDSDWRAEGRLGSEVGRIEAAGSAADIPWSARAVLALRPAGWLVDSLVVEPGDVRWEVWRSGGGGGAERYAARLRATSQAQLATQLAWLPRVLERSPAALVAHLDAEPCSLAEGETWGPVSVDCRADGGGASRGVLAGPGLELDWRLPAGGDGSATAVLDGVPLSGVGPLTGVASGILRASTESSGGWKVEGELELSAGDLAATPLGVALRRALPGLGAGGPAFERIAGHLSIRDRGAGAAPAWRVSSLAFEGADCHFRGAVSCADSLEGRLEGGFFGAPARALADVAGLGPVLLDSGGELRGTIRLGGSWRAPTVAWKGSARADSVLQAWTQDRTRALQRSLEAALGLGEGGLDDPLEQPTLERVTELLGQMRSARRR